MARPTNITLCSFCGKSTRKSKSSSPARAFTSATIASPFARASWTRSFRPRTRRPALQVQRAQARRSSGTWTGIASGRIMPRRLWPSPSTIISGGCRRNLPLRFPGGLGRTGRGPPCRGRDREKQHSARLARPAPARRSWPAPWPKFLMCLSPSPTRRH